MADTPERLNVQRGAFKGRPQQWFTRSEVIALLAQTASAQVEAVQAQPASITESLPICTKVPLVFAQPASAPMGEPVAWYDALPPSAMDWLTSSDPHLAATQEWQDGWDACRNRVHMRMDAAIKRAHGISGESSGAARKDGVRPTDGGQQ